MRYLSFLVDQKQQSVSERVNYCNHDLPAAAPGRTASRRNDDFRSDVGLALVGLVRLDKGGLGSQDSSRARRSVAYIADRESL